MSMSPEMQNTGFFASCPARFSRRKASAPARASPSRLSTVTPLSQGAASAQHGLDRLEGGGVLGGDPVHPADIAGHEQHAAFDLGAPGGKRNRRSASPKQELYMT